MSQTDNFDNDAPEEVLLQVTWAASVNSELRELRAHLKSMENVVAVSERAGILEISGDLTLKEVEAMDEKLRELSPAVMWTSIRIALHIRPMQIYAVVFEGRHGVTASTSLEQSIATLRREVQSKVLLKDRPLSAREQEELNEAREVVARLAEFVVQQKIIAKGGVSYWVLVGEAVRGKDNAFKMMDRLKEEHPDGSYRVVSKPVGDECQAVYLRRNH